MVDIHTHILNGIDDGSSSLDESILILSNLSKIGVTDVVLTPHYIEYSSYDSPKSKNMILLSKLKNELEKRNIDINLYLGNEIYINEDILSLLKSGAISSLNDSKYLLIELPMSGIYEDYTMIFKDLIDHGYKVILAHPERYASFQNDYSLVLELYNMGVLFQCNIESILKKYGKGPYKLIKKIAKQKLISFFGSDIHRNKKDYSYVENAKKKLKKYYSDKELNDLFYNNGKEILN